jgi:hypothetical protein
VGRTADTVGGASRGNPGTSVAQAALAAPTYAVIASINFLNTDDI